ncbi:MAG: hypothetical protein RLZZ450_1004 [Pseudomonadota bacterium]|jgi:hypothetical protein
MTASRVAVALGLTLLACADPRYGRGAVPEVDAAFGTASQQTAQDGAVSSRAADGASGASAASNGATNDAATALTTDAGAAAVGGPTGGDAQVSGGDPAAAPDAGSAPVVQTTTFPDWAAPLIGSYATRQFSFSRDRLGIVSIYEELSLVQIVRVEAGAELRAKLCSQVASSTEDVLKLIDPSGLSETVRKVTFDDTGHWGTDANPIGYGYDRPVPTTCVGKENQSIAKSAAQVWLADGNCRCPSSADAAPRIDDCRVLDPDNDKKPGLSFSDKGKPGALIGSFINSTLHAAFVSRTHPVSGRVDSQGAHHAQVVVDEVAYQLSCEPDGCPQIADVGRPCTDEFNDLHFVQLNEQRQVASCADLVARRTELFPSGAPATPSSCSQQVLTDDPSRK